MQQATISEGNKPANNPTSKSQCIKAITKGLTFPKKAKAGPRRAADALTSEQRAMYAAETLVNFRWIARIISTYSSHILSWRDEVSDELHAELAEIGQFAELSYSVLPLDLMYTSLDVLTQPSFPLHGYTAVATSTFVHSFVGLTAELLGFTAYRPEKKQLVVAVSGTARPIQALYDLHTLMRRHHSGRGHVHRGFYSLYQGIKERAFATIKTALQESKEDIDEIVLTGHSMGGAVAYLLAFDILADSSGEWGTRVGAAGKKLKLVVFGAPRLGDERLKLYWCEIVDAYRALYGEHAFTEYMVKAFNDGVPVLPPLAFGFRHCARSPLYYQWGRLYKPPPSESEYALFHLASESGEEVLEMKKRDRGSSTGVTLYPRGGHNYYNGRELETLMRRARWLHQAMSATKSYFRKPKNPLPVDGWEARYLELVAKHE